MESVDPVHSDPIKEPDDLGSLLKRGRELRGITLQEIAEATHIRPYYLEALEQNRLDKLPGLTFLKGYVRVYVQYVGLDLDEVMLRLETLIKQTHSPQPPSFHLSQKFFVILFFVLVVVFLFLIVFGVIF